MPRPIFFLTDFGLKDPYVGLMKARLVEESPAPRVIDLTHEVTHGSELEAAFLLEYSCPHLPEESVVVVVVDPEVGTDRQIIAVRTTANRYLVAPDTGILEGLNWERAVVVENKKLFRQTDCDTFHGRDRFAPGARFLSQGGELGFLGSELDRPPRGSIVPQPRREGNKIIASIVYIDRFGNCITNITREVLPDNPVFLVGEERITERAKTYEKLQGPGILFGSFNRAEIALKRDSAQEKLNLETGMEIEVETGP